MIKNNPERKTENRESVLENKNIAIAERYTADDEIDLFELFASLGKQWRWWLGITVLGVVLSVVIALSMPKQYEVNAQLVLPEQVQAMILTNKGYIKQGRKGLFQQYYQTLVSFENFSRYVKQGDWLSKMYLDELGQGRERELLTELKQALQIEVVKPKPIKGKEPAAPEVVMLTLLGKDEAVTADFINGYIDYSGKALIALIAQGGKQQKDLEVEKINIDMRLLRQDFQKKLTARLKVLNEALILAEKVGIKKPNDMKRETNQATKGIVINAANSSSDLFLKGSEYLKQTIDTLQSRESQDPYIKELFPLFARLERMDTMSFDFAGVKPYKLDKKAVVDGKAEKPKRALIVAVGSVLSLFVGVFVALIAGAVKRRKGLA